MYDADSQVPDPPPSDETLEAELISIIRRNSTSLECLDTGVEPQLQFLPDIQCVLFDIYGTLMISGSGDIGVNQELGKTESLSAALAATGIESKMDADELLNKFYAAIQDSHKCSREMGNEFPEVEIVKIWESAISDLKVTTTDLSRLAVEFETRVNPVWPMPGLAGALKAIRQTKDLGIISNAQFFTPLLFAALTDRTMVEWGFDQSLQLFSCDRAVAKPGRQLYQIAAETLAKRSILPDNVLYVGNDMLNDIVPAQHTGFKTCLFAGDQRSLRWRSGDQRVDGIEPEIIVTNLNQLEQCLDLR